MGSTSDKVSRSEIVTDALSQLRFLETQHGARLEEVDEGTQTVVAYITQRYTFELELDWREGAAFMLVANTLGDERPPGYYVHNGERVRVHLAEALRNGDAEDQKQAAELRAGASESGASAMKAQVTRYARVLKDALERDSVALR